MGLYNMVCGVNPATFFVLPLLGKHPDDYPRFRDCFIERRAFELEIGIPVMIPKEKPDGKIYIVLRVGGGNREAYADKITELRSTEGYVEDFNDEFDNTFATFVFKVPEQFKVDFEKICLGKLCEVSENYKLKLLTVYPKSERLLERELQQTWLLE